MSKQIAKTQTALEIVGFQNELVEKINVGDSNLNRAIKARLENPISSMSENEISLLTAAQVQKCAANLGQRQVDTEIVAQIISELSTELKVSFSNWTPTEVKEALRLGSIGKLGGGEIHVSAKNLLAWIEQYDQQFRKPAFNEIKKAKALSSKQVRELPPPELTREEIGKLIMAGYDMYQAGTNFGYSIYYQHLKALGLVNLSKTELWDWIRKAVVEILTDCSQEVGFQAARNAQRDRRAEIKSIDFTLEDNATLPSYVKARAMTLIVLDFYAGKSKEDLETLCHSCHMKLHWRQGDLKPQLQNLKIGTGKNQ